MSYKDAFSFCGRARDFNSPIHRDIIAFVCEFVIFRRLVAKTLDYREKLVLQLLYYEELPLKEVAGLLGVSMARVSQIKANAIEKLKRFLASVE